LNVAVVDAGANFVAFARMDGAQLGSIAVSRAQGPGLGEVSPPN
jgi:uncharacterized protein GlcG (DUF336 family)